MSAYYSPHDKFFKEIFSRLDLAEDFFRNYLPSAIASRIKPHSLEKLDDSFVDENLKSHFADLLFRVELVDSTSAYIYLLFEHKSSPEKFVAFQILRYLVRIWEKSLAEKVKKLPIVLPIVFYHGKRRWKVAENFADLFEIPPDLDSLREFLPEFKYYLVDLHKFDDENLAGEAALQAVLQLFKHIFDDDLQSKLLGTFKKLVGETEREKAFQILLVVINYILQTGKLGETELGKTLAETEEEIGEQAMITVLDRKFAEGKETGFQIGRKEALIETNLKLFTRKFGNLPKDIENQIRSLPVNLLQDLNIESGDIKSLDQLKNKFAK